MSSLKKKIINFESIQWLIAGTLVEGHRLL